MILIFYQFDMFYFDIFNRYNIFCIEKTSLGIIERFTKDNQPTYDEIKLQIQTKEMFRELTKWCQNEAPFCGQQRKYEVEVSPFFHVQEQLSRLPTFESQYVDKHSPHRVQKHRRPDRVPLIMPDSNLKRVKSQPDYKYQMSMVNGKENIHYPCPPILPKGPTSSVHYSEKRPQIRILYENQRNKEQSQTHRQSLKNSENSYTRDPQSPHSSLSRQGMSFRQLSPCPSSGKDENMVPLEQFNRMVNINLNLIKLIEEDYRPIRTSVSHLEKQHDQRRRMIEALQQQVRRIRGEMAGDL